MDVRLELREDADCASARRAVSDLAHTAGFDQVACVRLATVAFELARNAVRHGGGGEMHVRVLDEPGRFGIEILVNDEGPGIPEGTRDGLGLQACRRISDEFHLVTGLDGTTVTARKWRPR